ncbi:hypothetical protein V5O48_008204 [Marasmius crinis-equi]|uniref:Chromo domain-containing protein n=1 Tax=Marasmius crinis-equi TaxID=585013 RepID=A0ABR3FEP2_9AGAR
MSKSQDAWELGYIRAARQTTDGNWKYRVKWVGYSHHQNSWEPALNLLTCERSIEEFQQNSILQEIEDDGTKVYIGEGKWLKKKREEAKIQDAHAKNPAPTEFKLEAATLWNAPANFGLDPDNRTLSYQTALECLACVGINGSDLYKRVKADVKDPNDQDWISRDGCPICQEKHYDLGNGCLLACTDKKKIYCKQCVTGLLESQTNEHGQVQCSFKVVVVEDRDLNNLFAGPLCRKHTYLISTKWVFVNDEEKRQAAIEESHKRHRKNKKSKKRQRAAEQHKATASPDQGQAAPRASVQMNTQDACQLISSVHPGHV